MFSRTFFRRVQPSSTRIKQYIDHLYPKEGKELVPMADLMPAAADGLTTATEFQKLFVEHCCKELHHGNPSKAIAGWTCTLPGDSLLRNMGHTTETIYAPVPVELFTSSSSSHDVTQESENNKNNKKDDNDVALKISKKKHRVQSIEMTLAVQMEENSMSTPDPQIEYIAPAILVRASRYPFYASHTPGFAADLASCQNLVVSSNPIHFPSLSFDARGVGTVLTLGIEPVAVGYIQKQHLDAAATCSQYCHHYFDNIFKKSCSSQNNNNYGKKNWWIATGCLARVPGGTGIGIYTANFGLLGKVKIELEE